jgi:hypothetical protein
MDPYISIGKESIEKETLETKKKEKKDETETIDQLSPQGLKKVTCVLISYS